MGMEEGGVRDRKGEGGGDLWRGIGRRVVRSNQGREGNSVRGNERESNMFLRVLISTEHSVQSHVIKLKLIMDPVILYLSCTTYTVLKLGLVNVCIGQSNSPTGRSIRVVSTVVL